MYKDEKQSNVIQFNPKRGKILALVVSAAVLVMVVVLATCFKIEEIEVTGNKHYSVEQIQDYVLSEGYINNTLLLSLKNRFSPIEDIPFIARIDVEVINAHKVAVNVYEKAMAGCIEYMNQYVYFDQDGYVLEISPTKLEDAPCITGMSFKSMELREKLPIEDEKRFRIILNLTQQIQKYSLQINSIRFTSENEIVMKHGDIRIELGDGSNLEEQLTDLGQILNELEGKKGTLDMKDFDTASGRASFKLNTEQ
ncbi:MAG: cell division protein FtsQ/DivIB [Lachnospiraceae bacterium]|nr:cell division protein FtsQ/DivIB [Lachnospiraceae bacterium]